MLTISVLYVLAWMFDIDWIKHPWGLQRPLLSAYSVEFLLCSLIALLALHFELPGWLRLMPAGLALLVAGAGAANLIDHWFGLDLNLSCALWKAAGDALPLSYPGPMSPDVALSFFVTAICLALISCRDSRVLAVAQTTLMIVWFNSAIILGLNAFGHSELCAYFGCIKFSAITSVVFALLSLGILTARAESGATAMLVADSSGGRLLRRIFAGLVAMPIVIAAAYAGKAAGFYDEGIYQGISVALLGGYLVGGVIWEARKIDNVESERNLAEEQKRAAESARWKVEAEKRLVEVEKVAAEEAKAKAVAERQRIEQEKRAAEEATIRAEAEKIKAEAAKLRAEQAKDKAEAEKQQIQKEKQEVEAAKRKTEEEMNVVELALKRSLESRSFTGRRVKLVCPQCRKEAADGEKTCSIDGFELVAEAAALPEGTIFVERYEIIQLVGSGGMSSVFKARHRYLDRLVAIKLLHTHLAGDPTEVQRFQREAKAVSLLSHPNILSVQDFGLAPDGEAYLVMDFLDGRSLSAILDQEVYIPSYRALPMFLQICEGMQHAHDGGVLHRDLKPNNIVILKSADRADQAMIVDFGIAKLAGDEDQDLTRTGEILGSPHYVSPEVCLGRKADRRSDIYSMGCLMYECLGSIPPHVGQTSYETMKRHVEFEPAKIDAVFRIPERLEQAVFRSLDKEPDARQQSFAELAAELRLALAELENNTAAEC